MSSSKKIKSMIISIVMTFTMIVTSVNAFAYTFSFPSLYSGESPYKYTGSSTSTGIVAYVSQTSYNTHATRYRLCTPQDSNGNRAVATNVVAITSAAKREFSYNSGYGGKGQSYCLSGYPDQNSGNYSAYNVTGVWAD